MRLPPRPLPTPAQAPGGLIFPDKATLYIAAIEDNDYKEEKIEWWRSVYGFDMTCIRNLAMLEPLVDTVQGAAVISDASALMTVDIATVTKADLAFVAPFRLTVNRSDYCHAFVAYFDIAFSYCHRPVTFSTGPHAKYTHWKQTVFYLEDVLCCDEGEVIEGELRCRPNAGNHRDLDIELSYSFSGKNMSAKRTQPFRLR